MLLSIIAPKYDKFGPVSSTLHFMQHLQQNFKITPLFKHIYHSRYTKFFRKRLRFVARYIMPKNHDNHVEGSNKNKQRDIGVCCSLSSPTTSNENQSHLSHSYRDVYHAEACKSEEYYEQQDDRDELVPTTQCQSFRCQHQYLLRAEDAEILPFFPQYETQWFHKENMLVAWFEPNFSQARYNLNRGNIGSNACTLIAILMSSYCSSERVDSMHPYNHHLSYGIIKALGIAMLNGNEIYCSLKKAGRLPDVNLSIPEAIKCAGQFAHRIKEWRSLVYMQSLEDTLYTNAQGHLDEWYASSHAKRHNYLYIMLISDTRSVLIINNSGDESITLVDSHQHSACKGAAIAVVKRDNFRNLCTWFAHVLKKYNQSNPCLYELSFLYYRQK